MSTTTTMRVTPLRVTRSEWTKLRTSASTAWALLAAVALLVGFSALYSVLRVSRPPADPAGFDPTSVSLAGGYLAQIALGALGVLLATSEYGSGLNRTTLTAVPRRLPVLWGKAAALTAASVALCVPATVGAFVLGQSILAGQHLDTGFGQPGVARAVFGAALYLTVVALLGLGLGALMRSTGGALATLFGVLFGLQIAAGLLPSGIADQVSRYLPTPAGMAVTSVHQDPAALGPWTGFGVFCLYTAVVIAAAAWRLRRKDA